MSPQFLGVDVGSSSVKSSVVDHATGDLAASAFSPKDELAIQVPQKNHAEQHPHVWWDNFVLATKEALAKPGVNAEAIEAIGIAYQMHGLVLLDAQGDVLRPSIIWCDSRAVDIGNQAFDALGKNLSLEHYLNSPGNFTASKLAWVKQNEPEIFDRIHKAMLPGDYIAYRLTGEMKTTIPGLSEGIMWDFKEQALAERLLSYYGISADLVPDLTETFSNQGELSPEAAQELGLRPGIPVSYRAGDQPNNALSLNVLQPGEVAATAGTSAVIYGVIDTAKFDKLSRVNAFAHVNYDKANPRYGVLLCINGAGILNSWIKHNFGTGLDYAEMNQEAAKSPIGSHGLVFLPYGNGAERSLENRLINSSLHGLDFNTHSRRDVFRAALEGIVFAMNYGLQVMGDAGVAPKVVRVGNGNMFQSKVFQEAFACTTGATLELYNTNGSEGAARGAGFGAGIYSSLGDAFSRLRIIDRVEPNKDRISQYADAYQQWLAVLQSRLDR